jgi:hypothetical protein
MDFFPSLIFLPSTNVTSIPYRGRIFFIISLQDPNKAADEIK